MAETIYGPQSWTAGDFETEIGPGPTFDRYYESTAAGGPDAPLAEYPELYSMENMRRSEGAGPNGEHIADIVDIDYSSAGAGYTFAGMALSAFGPLVNGQWDTRWNGDGIVVEWWQHFPTGVLEESGFGTFLILTNGGGSGGSGSGLFSTNIFFWLRREQTTGDAFTWHADLRSPAALTTVNGPADVADGAWHKLRVVFKPSTVTGTFPGNGTIGSAIVASDGSFAVYKDAVLLFEATDIQATVNRFATSAPDHYYGKGLWHGYFDLPGAFTGTWVRSGTVSLSKHNLLTGQSHTVSGSNNWVSGANGTLSGNRTVLLNLDGTPRTVVIINGEPTEIRPDDTEHKP